MTTKRQHHRHRHLLALALLAPAASALFAQTAPATSAASAAAAAEAAILLDRFEVTEVATTYGARTAASATKTNTPLVETPASLKVINSQVLADQAIRNLAEAARNVSGIYLASNLGGRTDSLTIRGFRSTVFINSDFYKNGFRNNSRAIREMVNVDRIEFLKGPASVLYGRGSPTGIVNLVTKKPVSKFSASLDAGLGDFSYRRIAVDATGPVAFAGEKVAWRAAYAHEQSDSFRDHVTVDRDFLAPALLWRLGPATTLTVEAEYLKDSRPTDRGLVAVGTAVAPLRRSLYLGESTDKTTTWDYRGGYELKHAWAGGDWSLRHAFQAGGSLEDRYNAQPGNLAANNRTLARTFNDQRTIDESYFSQTEVVGKISSGPLSHTLLGGVEFGYEAEDQVTRTAAATSIDILAPIYNPNPTAIFRVTTDRTNEGRAFALYAQDQIALSEQWRLLAGTRWDNYRGSQLNDLTALKAAKKDRLFSTRGGLVFLPARDTSIYATAAQSFAPLLGSAFDGSLFAPEKSKAYEIGAKRDWFGGRLATTLALWDVTKSNVVTADLAHTGFSVQVGEQRAKGLDFDISGQLRPGWEVIVGYAYTQARTTRDNTIRPGNRRDNIPYNGGSVWTTYKVQHGALKGLGAGLGALYVGERKGDVTNTFVLGSFTRWDASLFYRSGRWRAQLNLKNLFDKAYIEGAQARTEIIPGAPFNVIGSVGYTF